MLAYSSRMMSPGSWRVLLLQVTLWSCWTRAWVSHRPCSLTCCQPCPATSASCSASCSEAASPPTPSLPLQEGCFCTSRWQTWWAVNVWLSEADSSRKSLSAGKFQAFLQEPPQTVWSCSWTDPAERFDGKGAPDQGKSLICVSALQHCCLVCVKSWEESVV